MMAGANLSRSRRLHQWNYDRAFCSALSIGHLAKGIDVGRPPEQEALCLVAIFFLKEFQFSTRLDALRKYRKAKRPTQSEYRTHDSCCLLVDIYRSNEGPVDLDLVEREGAKIRQG